MKLMTTRWKFLLGAVPALLVACASDLGEPGTDILTVVNEAGESYEVPVPVAPDMAIAKAGCTHIRFCNASGAQEVVCDTNDAACSGTARFNECMADATSVCGDSWLRMDFDPAIPCPISGFCNSGGLPISLITRD